jgi:hypothetical protein
MAAVRNVERPDVLERIAAHVAERENRTVELVSCCPTTITPTPIPSADELQRNRAYDAFPLILA